MQGILPYLISGISVGGQYALIAIGYTLVYGILRLINFAHGDVFMVAGLIMVYTTASMPMYISIPLVLIFTVILGFAIERVAYKPLRTAPRMSLMISAIGVSYLIQNLAFYLTGGLPQPVKTPIPWISDTVTLFGASTKRVTVVTPLLTIALVFALVALIKKTKIGMGMRAAAKDFETAQLMGVKINSVISMTFVIGSFLAAVGAMLLTHSDRLGPKVNQEQTARNKMRACAEKGARIGQLPAPGVYAQSNAADVPAISGETLGPVEESVPRVLRVRGLTRTIGEVTPEVSEQLALARNEADGSEALEESPYTIGRTPDVPRSGSFGMPGAAAPTGLAQPRARKARTTTPTEKKEESK